MNPISRMIAWRYLTTSMYEQSLSLMTIISFLGIFIGSCALALVSAIMHGFDVETRKQIQGINPQALIHSGEPLDVEKINAVLAEEFPAIRATSPVSTAFGLAQPEHDQTANPAVIMIEAIDPHTIPQVTTLAEKIVDASLNALDTPDTVIIGSSLAQELDVATGDTMTLLYPASQQPQGKKLLFNARTVRIGGFIKTGYEDIDGKLVLCAFALFDELFPDIEVQELYLRFAPDTVISLQIVALQNRLKLDVYTWQDLYPAMLAALSLEEYVYFLVIALITLVASMNVLSLLFMHILNKRTDIALLKAIGLGTRAIMQIFMYMGLGIALAATILGITCATFMSFCIDHYKLFPLPDAYYVSHVPAHMTVSILCWVLVMVICMSICAIFIPLRQLRTLSPATILRFER